MSDGFAYLDILFFAVAAAFVAIKLRSVLGKRTGNERPPSAATPPVPSQAGGAARPDNVVPLPERSVPPVPPASEGQSGIAADGDAGLKQGLTAIRLADPAFDLDAFLAGSRAAFGMIVESFEQGDKAALQPLLAPPVYRSFATVIDDRVAAGHQVKSELVSIRATELVMAELKGSAARLTVRFRSEQINCIKDSTGLVIEGDPGVIEEVVDLWTFERDVRSSDPNWALSETRSPE